MADFIRRLVSGPKARFQDTELGLDLDLVYVTDQIIVMGYPAAGLEGLYRNKREDAKRFLDHRHGKNYWVFNFCPIRENSYDPSVFDGRVTRFPFPDHHAPPLALLPLLAREMHAWLDGSPERVAVLHCKAGKGRSGTMACTYLLTLDSPPTAPSLNRNLSATERAQLHTEERINELPEDDDTVDLTSPEKPASHHRKPTLDTTDLKAAQLPPSDADGILDVDKATSPASNPRLGSPPNPERSFIDSLKGVLDLHTARRMKPASDPKSPDVKQKKQRQGVSIPSQRRWLYYWALLLAGDAPKDVLNHTKTPDGKSVTKSAKPGVRVTRIQVRMREGSNVTRRIVHATNVVLHKASSVRKPSSKTSKDRADSTSPTRDTPSPTSKSESTKDDPNQLWASVARYDDDLVDLLEKWEAWTRQEGSGGLAKRRGNSKTMHIDDIEHDLEQLFDSSGKWDSGKMVCSFARFGLRGAKDETVTVTQEEGRKTKVHTHTLRLLTDERWNELKNRVAFAPPDAAESVTRSTTATPAEAAGVTTENVKELENDLQKLDIPSSEANSMYDESEIRKEVDEGEMSEELEGLVVDASRELRVKLYIGKVFIGWFWFIPSFHMPHPPSGATGDPSTTRATFHLTKKDIDFALGLGSDIIDVDVDMEWVLPQAESAPAVDAATLPVKATSDPRADSLEEVEGQGGVGAVVQAIAGGDSDALGDAVKVGQASDV